MQKILLVVIAASLFSCYSKKRNPYDEYDYTFVKADSFEGILDRKYFINRFDTSRLMINSYWDNGNVLIKGFVHSGKRDGKLQTFNMNGTLLTEDSFIDGKNIYSKKYFVADTSVKIFKNGKLLPADSLDSFLKK